MPLRPGRTPAIPVRFKRTLVQHPKLDKATAHRLSRDLNVIALIQTKDFARKEARVMQRKIEGQRFSAFKRHPLAESTLERKKALGRSLRVMMATRRYVSSIKVQERAVRGGKVFHIGFDRRRLALDTVTGKPRRALTLNRVALMHEFGGKRAPYPARPHWGPQFELVNMRAFALRDRIKRLAALRVRRILGM